MVEIYFPLIKVKAEQLPVFNYLKDNHLWVMFLLIKVFGMIKQCNNQILLHKQMVGGKPT